MFRSAHRTCIAVSIALLAACAATPPSAQKAEPADAAFEPAPMPSVQPARRANTIGDYQIVIPPRVPPNTGAVPVSNSPFRGSIVTGVKESF